MPAACPKSWPERTWAIENASGLGYLLAQQLVSAGERVLDVQAKLATRARLLDNGDVNKDDPNDARSVAVAAMRAKRLTEVAKEDHTAGRRHRHGSQRACQRAPGRPAPPRRPVGRGERAPGSCGGSIWYHHDQDLRGGPSRGRHHARHDRRCRPVPQ